jgi:hypothetical protein
VRILAGAAVQICGWFSVEMACASSWKRLSAVTGFGNFYRDQTAEASIDGPIHRPHATGADERLNFVRAKLRAGVDGLGGGIEKIESRGIENLVTGSLR